jgi:hypothetical protein
VPSTSKTFRRFGSATALKGSKVVGVRAMLLLYSYIGICQGVFLYLCPILAREGFDLESFFLPLPRFNCRGREEQDLTATHP